MLSDMSTVVGVDLVDERMGNKKARSVTDRYFLQAEGESMVA